MVTFKLGTKYLYGREEERKRRTFVALSFVNSEHDEILLFNVIYIINNHKILVVNCWKVQTIYI